MLETTTTPVFGTADYTDYEALYSFTPTVLTHDIQNFDPFANNGLGRMHYDMKSEGLMYQSKSSFDSQDPVNASSFFGYPHFKDQVSLNHYTMYTPFDAVFSWDRDNNVHLTNYEIIFDQNRNKPWWRSAKGGWVVNENDNSLRVQVRDFLVGESDYFNAYIQNRRYGWNANPNALYKATVLARNEISAGRNVTERTNFRNVEIWDNADITFEACKTIFLKPGFHAKPGSTFHSKITTENCSCGGVLGKSGQMNNQNNHPNSENGTGEILENEINNLNSVEIKLYPNPGKNVVNLVVEDETADGFEYRVFSTMGILVEKNYVGSNRTKLFLKKGIYIVKIKYNGTWYTKKLIMQ